MPRPSTSSVSGVAGREVTSPFGVAVPLLPPSEKCTLRAGEWSLSRNERRLSTLACFNDPWIDTSPEPLDDDGTSLLPRASSESESSENTAEGDNGDVGEAGESGVRKAVITPLLIEFLLRPFLDGGGAVPSFGIVLFDGKVGDVFGDLGRLRCGELNTLAEEDASGSGSEAHPSSSSASPSSAAVGGC